MIDSVSITRGRCNELQLCIFCCRQQASQSSLDAKERLYHIYFESWMVFAYNVMMGKHASDKFEALRWLLWVGGRQILSCVPEVKEMQITSRLLRDEHKTQHQFLLHHSPFFIRCKHNSGKMRYVMYV